MYDNIAFEKFIGVIGGAGVRVVSSTQKPKGGL